MNLFLKRALYVVAFPVYILFTVAASLALSLICVVAILFSAVIEVIKLFPIRKPESEATTEHSPVNVLFAPVDHSVIVDGLKIRAVLEQTTAGYRVSSVEHPSIYGFGCTVSAARYDFYLMYKGWLGAHGLIGSYYRGCDQLEAD